MKLLPTEITVQQISSRFGSIKRIKSYNCDPITKQTTSLANSKNQVNQLTPEKTQIKRIIFNIIYHLPHIF